MKFNPDKHHRRSIRLKGYDYSQNGAYYVTICTINHDCFLSTINQQTNVGADLASAQNDTIIHLTKAGEFVEKNWLDIPNRYKHVFLDEYVIMPNHIHGIVVITTERTTARVAPTLGDIIGSFKSKCVIEYLNYINDHNMDIMAKLWQRNYYEHIIRDENELNRIRKYIQENPYRWADDNENPDNIV